MKSVLMKIAGFYETLPERLRKHKPGILIVFLVFLVAAGAGNRFLIMDMSMESWFRRDDPAVQAFYRLRDNFGSDDSVYIVYRAKDGDVFSEQSLRAVADLQEELMEASFSDYEGERKDLGHIVEITSLINVSYMEVEGDMLESRDFVGDDIPETKAEQEALRRQALEHKDYPEFYVSEDSEYGGIFIRTDFGTELVGGEDQMGETDEFDMDFESVPQPREPGDQVKRKYKLNEIGQYAEFMDALEKIISKPKYSEKLEFHPVGNPVIMDFFNEILNIELSYFLLATLVIMLVVLYFLFRSFSAVIWPILIVIFTVIITLGLVGWVGAEMNMMISLLIMMVLVVGIADSVHILSGYQFFRKGGKAHKEAMNLTMKRSGFACMLTSVTTAVGLLSMSVVPIPPIAVFGVSAAVGVLLAFILTVILLPLLLDIWRPKIKVVETGEEENQRSIIQSYLRKIEPCSRNYPKTAISLFLIVAVIGLYGLSKVKVDSNMVELIEPGHPIRESSELVDEKMGGTQNLEILLNFSEQDALKDPAVLNAMDDLQQYLLEEHSAFAMNTTSLVNVVKNSYQVLNRNREEMYKIPQDRRTLAQTLFLFDSANPDDRKLLVTDDYALGRLTVRVKNYGSIEYLEFFEAVQSKIDELFSPLKSDYPEMNIELTGGLALMMELVDYMSWSQVQSFGLALLVITIMLLFVFGSPKIGLMGMIPNLFPVIMTFGTMGFFDIPLDADTLIIAPVVIGIAVDDTIHFLTHFRTEMVETGDVTGAIKNSIFEVGQAITFSTIILVAGFIVLIFCSHQGMAHFGYLTAVAFISALLADLFLLPSLCSFFKRRREGEPVRNVLPADRLRL